MNAGISCIAAGCAATLLLSTMAAASTAVDATVILGEVGSHGARATVEVIRDTGNQWDLVTGNISQGEPQWLEVAAALRPGADGGAAETLDEAVFLALKPSAKSVLELLHEHAFDIAAVCGSNIATDYAANDARRMIQDRIDILKRLPNGVLAAERDKCLVGLQSALKDVSR